MVRFSVLVAVLFVSVSPVLAGGCAGQPPAPAAVPTKVASPAAGAQATKPPTGSPTSAAATKAPAPGVPAVSATRPPVGTAGSAGARPTTPPPPAPSKALFLDVVSPAEDTAVDSPLLEVSGRTIPDAVVSVDGDLVVVRPDGSFATRITLDEGANDVEVVASDSLGNEQSVIRSVIYEP